jgi:hypothetical protein
MTKITKLILTAQLVFIVVMLPFVAFILGPSIESRYFPVFTDVTPYVLDTSEDRNMIMMTANGNKVRGICVWTSINAMVLRNGEWVQGMVYFTDPHNGDKSLSRKLPPSRPAGMQNLGTIFVFPNGQKIKVHVRHRCHPLWETPTFLYETDVDPSPK